MAFELEVLAMSQLSDEFIGLAIAALALQAEKRTSSKKYGPRGAGWVHRVVSAAIYCVGGLGPLLQTIDGTRIV